MKNPLLQLTLTSRMLSMMVKGALPPTIATAIYQIPAISKIYGNFGFIITIGSILALHLLPRNRFLQNLGLAAFLTCLAAATTLLAHYLGLKARHHAHAPPHGYSSSASAINAIFLCGTAWVVSSLRAAYPQFAIPFLICTIFSMVGLMFGPEILVEASSHALVRQLLTAYLTGFGISTAVGLLLFPKTCRALFLERSRSFLKACQELLEAEQEHFKAISGSYETIQQRNLSTAENKSRLLRMSTGVTTAMSQLTEELSFADTEISFGTTSSKTLHEILFHLQALLIPLLGLSRFGCLDQVPHTDSFEESDPVWKLTSECFEETKYQLQQASRHALLSSLDENSRKAQKSISDPEKDHSTDPVPGEIGYAPYLHTRLRDSENHRKYEMQGLRLSYTPKNETKFNSDGGSKVVNSSTVDLDSLNRIQKHLYLQSLLSSLSVAAWELASYSESTMVNPSKSKMISMGNPWISLWTIVSTKCQKPTTRNEIPVGFDQLRDPEHQPPTSSLETFGDATRHALRTLSSDSSQFGLRVAAATMSIGILGFLRQTQSFFVEYRLVWAMVMIPISMSPTSGNAIYGFAGRAFGTALAMLMAYANWYIVDGHRVGVIVLFFVSMLVYYHFLLRYPRFIVVFILAAVNHVLIIGYELQVDVNGTAKATASGQKYFPLYILAPYRLLCVIAGLFVALFWTIFPVQISEHSILRRKVSLSLSLLAKYAGSVSGTLQQRLHDLEGDLALESSLGRRLKGTRYKILYEELGLLSQMRDHSAMTEYEVSIGGKFPKEDFDRIIDEIQSIVALLSVVAYISQAFQSKENSYLREEVASTRSESVIRNNFTAMITVLSILASSMATGAPLPQGLKMSTVNREVLPTLALAHEPIVVVYVAIGEAFRSVEKIILAVNSIVGQMTFDIEEGSESNGASFV